jgi:hypothetical protein
MPKARRRAYCVVQRRREVVRRGKVWGVWVGIVGLWVRKWGMGMAMLEDGDEKMKRAGWNVYFTCVFEDRCGVIYDFIVYCPLLKWQVLHNRVNGSMVLQLDTNTFWFRVRAMTCNIPNISIVGLLGRKA